MFSSEQDFKNVCFGLPIMGIELIVKRISQRNANILLVYCLGPLRVFTGLYGCYWVLIEEIW